MVIGIGFGSLSSAKIISNTAVNSSKTIVKLSNWTNTAEGLRLLSNFVVTNPQASLEYTTNFALYHISNNATYNIQGYYLVFKVLAIAFNSVSGTNSVEIGKIEKASK